MHAFIVIVGNTKYYIRHYNHKQNEVHGGLNNQEKEDIVQYRKLLLDFHSSELTAHSRLIIGFAVLLLTISEVSLNLPKPVSIEQTRIAFFGCFFASIGFWYVLIRHLAYGILANASITAALSCEAECVQRGLFTRLRWGINGEALNRRILGIIDSGLFISMGGSVSPFQKLVRKVWIARVIGGLFCSAIALITTLLMLTLVGLMILDVIVWSVIVGSFILAIAIAAIGYAIRVKKEAPIRGALDRYV